MSKGVLIQASFYEAMRYLPDGQRLELYDSICSYSLYGVEPENLSPVAMSMFILMKPNIDSSSKRYTASVANGKKGGRKTETQEEPSDNREETQEEPGRNPEETKKEPSGNPAETKAETREETKAEPSGNLDITQQEPSGNQSHNQSANQSHNQSHCQSANQSHNQKPNHDYDYDYDLDYDLDYDYDSNYDSDSDSDSDSQRRGAAKTASPKSSQKEKNIFFQDSKRSDREIQEEFCKKRQKAMDLLLKSHYFSNDRASPIGMPAV